MPDLLERICVALVLLGAMLIITLFTYSLPLSAGSSSPSYEMPRPALLEWPSHGHIEYRG